MKIFATTSNCGSKNLLIICNLFFLLIDRSLSSTSLQNINEDESNLLLSPDLCDTASGGETVGGKEWKERRKSLSKRFRKKAASIDVAGFLMIGE